MAKRQAGDESRRTATSGCEVDPRVERKQLGLRPLHHVDAATRSPTSTMSPSPVAVGEFTMTSMFLSRRSSISCHRRLRSTTSSRDLTRLPLLITLTPRTRLPLLPARPRPPRRPPPHRALPLYLQALPQTQPHHPQPIPRHALPYGGGCEGVSCGVGRVCGGGSGVFE